MFGFIRFVMWTVCAVAFGVFLGSADLGGKTPLEHLQGLYAQNQPELQQVRAGAGRWVDGVRQTVGEKAQAAQRPTEHHSADDQAAIERLIAKRPGR